MCLVECGGAIVHGNDKLVCTERTIVVRMDAEPLLRYFSRQQALSVIHLWDPPQVVLDYLMGDDAARAAARVAAWDTARAATWAAARATARAAAWDTARVAAWDTARAAARAAARDAAWDAAWYAARYAARAAARVAFNALVYDAFADWLED